jgi:peptidoglycan hydrolase CwlO-like protein
MDKEERNIATITAAILITVLMIGSLAAYKKMTDKYREQANRYQKLASSYQKQTDNYNKLKNETVKLRNEIENYRKDMTAWYGLWEKLFPGYKD